MPFKGYRTLDSVEFDEKVQQAEKVDIINFVESAAGGDFFQIVQRLLDEVARIAGCQNANRGLAYGDEPKRHRPEQRQYGAPGNDVHAEDAKQNKRNTSNIQQPVPIHHRASGPALFCPNYTFCVNAFRPMPVLYEAG
jgi:hypothetical protein